MKSGAPCLADSRMPDGLLVADRDAPVGGQAVMEGVMMRGVSTWAVAVRKPDGQIDTVSEPLVSWAKRHPALRWPVIRGVVALAESLKIGFRGLQVSANAQLAVDEEPQEVGGWAWVLTVIGAMALAIGLFFVVPVGATSLIKDELGSAFLFWLVEGVLRTTIFIGYLLAISRLPDLRRVFEYHGAEHKTISCYEAGDALLPERAEAYSRYHPRCGTTFLLIVMIISFFVFSLLGQPPMLIRIASRIVLIPVIAGIAYEVIKWTGARYHKSATIRTIMAPGLAVQKLTTREPDLDQIAVAIAALQPVLDAEEPKPAAEADAPEPRVAVAAAAG